MPRPPAGRQLRRRLSFDTWHEACYGGSFDPATQLGQLFPQLPIRPTASDSAMGAATEPRDEPFTPLLDVGQGHIDRLIAEREVRRLRLAPSLTLRSAP